MTYEQDEAACDIFRSKIPCQRSSTLHRVLPEDRLYVRRAMGRLLRHRCFWTDLNFTWRRKQVAKIVHSGLLLGYRKRIVTLCGMWIARRISALLGTVERN